MGGGEQISEADLRGNCSTWGTNAQIMLRRAFRSNLNTANINIFPNHSGIFI